MTKKEIAKYIDHTLLAPQATESEIIQLCKEAKQYQFASVCINPSYIELAASELKNTGVKVCTVIGFPLGAVTPYDKAMETKWAIKNGADEVDMVINIGAARDKKFAEVEKDISAVVKAARSTGRRCRRKITVKVILETCLIDDETIVQCCLCAKNAGADFVKTSTGFATPKDAEGKLLPNGATEHHVKIMRQTVGNEMSVKASGGIRSAQTAVEMLNAGANRIGTSSGVKIVENWDESVQVNVIS